METSENKVRRTSEICIFDSKDEDILNSKVDLFEEKSENFGKHYRMMSNNSVMFFDKPSKEELKTLAERIKNSGEPERYNRAICS